MWRRSWISGLLLVLSLVFIWSLASLIHPVYAQSAPASSRWRAALSEDMPMPIKGAQTHTKLGAPSAAKPSANDTLDPSCWNLVPSNNPSPTFDQVYGMAALSPKNIWAVGFYCINCGLDTEVEQTLIEHWNGSMWTVVPSPNTSTSLNFLSSISAVSPNDIWAVGYVLGDTRIETLTEHWNGTAWSVVPSPNPGPFNNYLDAVTAISPNDVWAVGTYRNGPLRTLTLHWDGTAWNFVDSPYPGTARNLFFGVSAIGPNNVWAVGTTCDIGECNFGAGRTLIGHWNGTTWSVVTSPNAGAGANGMNSISAVNPNDIWAGGFYCSDVDCTTSSPLLLHWDGTSWSISPHTFTGSVNSTYWSIVAISPKDVWAGGSFSGDGNTWTNLMSHWNGSTWTDVSVTSPGVLDNDLRALAAIGSNNVWAVGDYDNGAGEQIQTQQYNGPCR